jgi:hypothetical protein
MALTAETSTQIAARSTPGTILMPADMGAKLRFKYFTFTQGAAAGDANSTADLVYLPAGKVRIFGGLSRVSHSAFGASRVLDVGHTGFTQPDGTAVVADEDFLHSAADISGAGGFAPMDETGNDQTIVYHSKTEVLIRAKCEAGTIPIGATLEGFIVYAHE